MPTIYHFLLSGLVAVQALAFIAAKPSIARAQDPQAFDLQEFLTGEFQAGRRLVVIPPGVYRVTPGPQGHLIFNDLSDLEIVAEGVEMVCTATSQAIGFVNCRNVTLRGLSVDYDPLPFTQGRITRLPPDKSWVEFEIISGYPDTQLEQRIEIFDPATRELRRETTYWSDHFDSLGGHRYRIAKAAGYHFDPNSDTEQVGDILVTNHRSAPGVWGHAITATDCVGLKLQDVSLYAAECFGILEHQCESSTYLRCKIDRRPAASDPLPRGFPRLRSLNADAFHSEQATIGPAILDCTAKFQGDDCVNIHGTYHLVTDSRGGELRIAALDRVTIQPGDPVEFLPYSGVRPVDAIAQRIEPDLPITDEEREFIRQLRMNEDNRQRLLDGKAQFFRLTLDRPTPLAMGSAVCSGKCVGNGFAVRGCDFGYNRSRGILIKASRGEVTSNRITGSWMAAVLVSPEFWWFEAASSSDLKIEDNTITGCRQIAIEVLAPGGSGQPLASGAHRDITIGGNTVTASPWPNIHVTSTEQLVVKDNRLAARELAKSSPPTRQPWNWGAATPAAIVTELCDEAEVQTVSAAQSK